MKPELKMRRFKFLKYLFSVLLALSFLYVAFKGVDWSKFTTVFLGVNYVYIFFMVVVMLLSHFFRSWRWGYLLYPVKSGVRVNVLFEATMIGYFANNLIPRSGEFLKAYTVSRTESISVASTVASVFVERVIDLGFSLLLFIVALLWNKNIFEKHYPWLGDAVVVVSIIIAVAIIIILMFLIWGDFMSSLVESFISKFSPRLGRRAGEVFKSFVAGFKVLKYGSLYFKIFLLSFLVYICYVFSAYIPLFAFKFKSADIGFFTALVIFTVSTVSFILPTPGGIGSYHTLTAGVLTALYGVNRELALGYAVLTHGVIYMLNTILGFYFAMRRHISLAKGE